MVIAAVKVSILAMGVIFLVLSILIGVIELMVKFIPYVPPAPVPVKPRATAAGDQSEQVAAIHAALAHHLGQPPESIHITQVRSLS